MSDLLSSAAASGDSPLQALIHSYTMILLSELGDKTFLIAAILAMRHPRLPVFLGAFSSLALMSLLSALMGHVLPTVLPRKWTTLAAAILFGVFGVKMGMEGREMESGSGKIREEMREAEEEIEEDDAEHERVVVVGGGGEEGEAAGKAIPLERMEEGEAPATPSKPAHGTGKPRPLTGHRRGSSSVGAGAAAGKKGWKEGARNFCSLVLGPVFVQAFILTFLGEWGDRSQIATIALGAAHNVYLVTLGTIVGHGCCTALAVIGGRYVSTKISVKHVTLVGSALFLLFAIIYLYEAYTMGEAGSELSEMGIPLTGH